MKILRLFAVLIIVISISGCATILSGSNQDITFDSEPRGAKVIIDGNVMGVTPLTVSLNKNKYEEVKIMHEGYQPQVRPLSKSYDPVTLVNIFWDLSTTDLITGNAFQYDPSSYYFTLEKK